MISEHCPGIVVPPMMFNVYRLCVIHNRLHSGSSTLVPPNKPLTHSNVWLSYHVRHVLRINGFASPTFNDGTLLSLARLGVWVSRVLENHNTGNMQSGNRQNRYGDFFDKLLQLALTTKQRTTV